MNPILKQISKRVFLAYQKKLYHTHPLKWIELEITRRCNLACLHCGSSCSVDSPYPHEMSQEQILSIFKRLAEVYDPSDIRVAITGGEPLVRKDIYHIMAHLSKMGYRLSLVSNGMLIDEKSIRYLTASGLKFISISFDGMRENHNWLRANPQAFDHVVRAMRLLKTSGLFYVEPLTTVNQRNLNELEKMEDLLTDIGVDSWRLFQTMPIGRAPKIPGLLLKGSQMIRLFDFIKEHRKHKGLKIWYGEEGYLGDKYELEIRDTFHKCAAGVYLLSILANGDIIGCTAMDASFVEGNALTEDVVEVWENRFQRYRDREWMRSGICTNCKEFDMCQGDGMHLRLPNQEGPVRCVNHMIR